MLGKVYVNGWSSPNSLIMFVFAKCFSCNVLFSLGTKKSKLVTIIIGIILMFAISFLITFQILILRSDLLLDVGGNQFSNPQIWGANYISIVYMFIILIMFFYVELLILNAKSKTNFTKVSKLLKFLMLLSILSIPVFSLTYFYV